MKSIKRVFSLLLISAFFLSAVQTVPLLSVVTDNLQTTALADTTIFSNPGPYNWAGGNYQSVGITSTAPTDGLTYQYDLNLSGVTGNPSTIKCLPAIAVAPYVDQNTNQGPIIFAYYYGQFALRTRQAVPAPYNWGQYTYHNICAASLSNSYTIKVKTSWWGDTGAITVSIYNKTTSTQMVTNWVGPLSACGTSAGTWSTPLSWANMTCLAANLNGMTGQIVMSNVSVYLDTTTTCNLTYNGNGNDGGTAPSSGAYTACQSVSLPDAGTMTKTGLVFNGWNTKANGTGTAYAAGASFSMPAQDCTLYAQWVAPTTYTLTYSGNGNTAGSTPAPTTVPSGVNVVLPTPDPSLAKDGYQFGGWNTEANGSGTTYPAASNYSMPAQNTTLYALWIPYTLTYSGNGNTAGTTPAPGAYVGGTVITLPTPDPLLAKTSCAFNGWNTAADGTGTTYAASSSYTMPSANTTLYANWVADTSGWIVFPEPDDQGKTYLIKEDYNSPDGTSVSGWSNTAKTLGGVLDLNTSAKGDFINQIVFTPVTSGKVVTQYELKVLSGSLNQFPLVETDNWGQGLSKLTLNATNFNIYIAGGATDTTKPIVKGHEYGIRITTDLDNRKNDYVIYDLTVDPTTPLYTLSGVGFADNSATSQVGALMLQGATAGEFLLDNLVCYSYIPSPPTPTPTPTPPPATPPLPLDGWQVFPELEGTREYIIEDRFETPDWTVNTEYGDSNTSVTFGGKLDVKFTDYFGKVKTFPSPVTSGKVVTQFEIKMISGTLLQFPIHEDSSGNSLGRYILNGSFVTDPGTYQNHQMIAGHEYGIRILTDLDTKSNDFYVWDYTDNVLICDVKYLEYDNPAALNEIADLFLQGCTAGEMILDNFLTYKWTPAIVTFGTPAFTDKDGGAVSGLTNGGSLKATVSVSNTYDSSKDYVLILVIKDGSNVVQKAVATTGSIAGNYSDTVSVTLPQLPDNVTGMHAELFIWDGTSTLIPYTAKTTYPAS